MQVTTDTFSEFIEWDKKDPSSSSWVSPRHRYFFVGLGKTASTRIKLSLHLLEGCEIVKTDTPNEFPWIHTRAGDGAAFVPKLTDFPTEQAVEILTAPGWFRFCFVRNPYDRLFAAYKSYIMQEGSVPSPFYSAIRDQIRVRGGYRLRTDLANPTVAFRDFVSYVEETMAQRQDYHWCQMTWGLRPDLVAYDFVGYFETFVEDFRQVLQRLGVDEALMPALLAPVNESATRKLPLAAVYDWELADRVYALYRDDFETYRYAKDSWLA